MWLKLILLSLFILILFYNVFYSFLPQAIQGVIWVKILAIVCAFIILIYGIKQELCKYCNYKFAYISAKDGKILKKKNFPWNISKSTHRGNVYYCINERYGDVSDVSIKPDKPTNKYSINFGVDGIFIEFICSDEEIPNFKIEIK